MDTNLILKIESYLRLLLLLSLFALLLTYLFFPLDSCDLVELRYNNKSIDYQDFMQEYKAQCLTDNNLNISYEMEKPFNFSDLKIGQ